MMKSDPALWDTGFGNSRSTEEWERLFFALRDSLSEHLGLQVFVEDDLCIDDEDNAQHSCIGASIRIPVCEPLRLILVGTLTLSVNHNDIARADAILLAFCDGKRLMEHKLSGAFASEVVWLKFKRTHESCGEWTFDFRHDEFERWQMFLSLEDWDRPPENSEP